MGVMMDLFNITSGAVSLVNDYVPAVIKINTGYVTAPSGKRTPSYSQADVSVQLQELSSMDLKQMDSLNVQGITRVAYVHGNFSAINRANQTGGDILVVNGNEWLIVKIAELWYDWCKLIINLQRKT